MLQPVPFAIIPVVGEVLAGTCMVGALVTYNGALAACEQTGTTSIKLFL